MLGIECDICNSLVFVDEVETRLKYESDANYLVDDAGKILERTIQDYLIYRCVGCGQVYKLTYKEWEQRAREKLAKEIMLARKFHIFKHVVDPKKVDPDNGLEWCGKCDGVDGEGNCFTDIIKVCTLI